MYTYLYEKNTIDSAFFFSLPLKTKIIFLLKNVKEMSTSGIYVCIFNFKYYVLTSQSSNESSK